MRVRIHDRAIAPAVLGDVQRLVGSFEEVADRIEEYHQHGFSEFIFSGYPHLEEAQWCGDGLIPELQRRGLLDGPDTAQETRVFSFR